MKNSEGHNLELQIRYVDKIWLGTPIHYRKNCYVMVEGLEDSPPKLRVLKHLLLFSEYKIHTYDEIETILLENGLK